MQGGDLVALDAKHHKSCYRNATWQKTLDTIRRSKEPGAENVTDPTVEKFVDQVEKQIIHSDAAMRKAD